METSPFICSKYQWTGHCMIETSVMNELKEVTTYFGNTFLI